MAGLLERCFKRSCLVRSQGGWIVLFWTILVNQLTIYSTGYLFIYNILQVEPGNVFLYATAVSLAQMIGFLIYPITGLLADVYWTRYYTMYSGLIFQLVGTVILTVSSVISYFHNEVLSSWAFLIFLIVTPLGLIQFGVGLQASNAVQFATDQMPGASSDELSAFVYWYFGAIFAGNLEASSILLVSLLFTSFGHSIQITILCVCFLQLICLSFGMAVIAKLKSRLVNEAAGRNPMKLILSVVKYTWHHRAPQFQSRSAFTYGDEMPNRFDYAKTRYGGKFTTEEVEDTKTFFRVLLLMLSAFGFWFTDETNATCTHMQEVKHAINATLPDNGAFDFISSLPFTGSLLVIITFIPIYQCCLRQCLHRYLPSMLKRIFIGLVCSIIAILVLQAMELVHSLRIEMITTCDRCSLVNGNPNCLNNLSSWLMNESSAVINFNTFLLLPYQTVLIAQIANGIAFLFVFLTFIEFTLAQAPRLMQGFLIGIWYSFTSFKILLGILSSISAIDCQVYSIGVRAVAMLILLLIFTMVAVRYKRRTRDEYTNINSQHVIEEYYTRQLERQNLNDLGKESRSVHFHISDVKM